MNDRFLFRAKRVDNGEWVEGYYANVENEHYIVLENIEWDDDANMELPQFIKLSASTICQCTGSREMSGNRIYENDIITYGKYKGIVKFGLYDSKHLGFHIEWMKGYGYGYLRKDFPYWVPEIKVVGNVFDNPELLGVE